MKNNTLLLTSVAVLALGLASCSKNEPATTAGDAAKAADSAADAASKAAEAAKMEAAKAADAAKVEAARVAADAKVAAEKASEAAKAEADKATAAAKAEAARTAELAKAEAAKVEAAKAAASAKTQGLIVKATSLIADGKFADASNVLQELAGQTLSSDQQKVVDSLKEQVQKALVAQAAANAANSVGNLLKK